jgi:hypothetical protein
MRHREAARRELAEQRLDVPQPGPAGGRVAHVADRRRSGEGADHLVPAEIVGDMAEAAVTVELAAVPAGHAGRFLAAMLEGVEAESGDRGGALRAPDAEHAALLAQLVAVQVALERMSRQHRPQPVVPLASVSPSPGGHIGGTLKLVAPPG